MSEVTPSPARTGVVLSGGGARGAYEAGVISGIVDILGAQGPERAPFSIFTGISVGAIAAATRSTIPGATTWTPAPGPRSRATSCRYGSHRKSSGRAACAEPRTPLSRCAPRSKLIRRRTAGSCGGSRTLRSSRL
ncbi:MAG: patatin-like phospholipase family protein [Deltaproteobacteria bacterium]|nr:patatin-like phospholipase family protein [Deltaproteobacteria bacterium]